MQLRLVCLCIFASSIFFCFLIIILLLNLIILNFIPLIRFIANFLIIKLQSSLDLHLGLPFVCLQNLFLKLFVKLFIQSLSQIRFLLFLNYIFNQKLFLNFRRKRPLSQFIMTSFQCVWLSRRNSFDAFYLRTFSLVGGELFDELIIVWQQPLKL